ncbi:hypothetical protein SALBM217S_07471 [Streptomyces griseoloalbus]
MKLQRKNRLRATALGALAVSGALVLTACGSDDNSAGDAPSTGDKTTAASSIDCGKAKGQLRASGSSAQKNAMDLWVKNYMAACSGVKRSTTTPPPPVRASSPSTRAPSASPAPTPR